MSVTSNPFGTMSVQLRHHRFSVEAYDEMVAHGILTSDDRVELLAGEIVEMSPIGPPHNSCVLRLTQFFSLALGKRAVVGVQSPIVLPPDSEPEPDIAILQARDDFYAAAHPRPGDILLLIEVADSSLLFDRVVKLPLYAAAGIVEVWIVDLGAKAIEVYTLPEQGRYATHHVVRGDTTIVPTALPELSVHMRDVLGPG
ncbi:MAG TPA: Uma2 family endonuclease [Candidatus Acidoferrales bacterium]|nr:Uma2 family endonuclease [Candidatus Acidoferrales bacterium]